MVIRIFQLRIKHAILGEIIAAEAQGFLDGRSAGLVATYVQYETCQFSIRSVRKKYGLGFFVCGHIAMLRAWNDGSSSIGGIKILIHAISPQ